MSGCVLLTAVWEDMRRCVWGWEFGPMGCSCYGLDWFVTGSGSGVDWAAALLLMARLLRARLRVGCSGELGWAVTEGPGESFEWNEWVVRRGSLACGEEGYNGGQVPRVLRCSSLRHGWRRSGFGGPLRCAAY